jgi:xanthine dehydrogenase accessory factor
VEDLLDRVDRWRREDLRVAVARVVEIAGEADEPDGPGASDRPGDADEPDDPEPAMAVNERGEVVGSVSACVEAAVVAAALEVLRHGHPRLVTFGHSGDQAFSVGLAAGGTVHVLFEPLE